MGKSSKDKRDVYYRLAKEQNWRARSAFKLIQIDEQFDLFSYSEPEKCTRVVDLCAAPGSWSQVLSRVLIKGESFGRRAWVEKMERLQRAQVQVQAQVQRDNSLARGDMSSLEEIISTTSGELNPRANVKIVAIDLQPMAPLEGITQLKADITHPSTVPLLLRAIDPDFSPQNTTHLIDLVISDGAPDVTGLHSLDIYVQSQLLYSALTLATKVLRPGGKFVAKIFRGRDVDLIYAQLRILFERVSVAKPRASRASSIEAFVVCEGYKPVMVTNDDGKEVLWTPEIEVENGLRLPESAAISTPLSAVREQQQEQFPLGSVPEDSHETDDSNSVSASQSSIADTHSQQRIQMQQTRHLRPDGIVELRFPSLEDADDPRRYVAPFLACGDLSAWDSDATYKLPEGHVSLDPVQPPTAPPYRLAIEKRRIDGGMYGKTKHKG
ncbi:23S rRNA (-2'-O)-methyltransferase [Cladophialophora psammophila CBS 110553]|uniref:Putative tRNA (cytidine(32)/guanosine(34)-2'-O)-methyltransferase n=1 Tax=Cladophialophora psammophila CBS 110553 TaxID=1182543 RepID=W9XG71_9EURO|nr:23S rRNA (-2'-O)-methyltransferase [Cladophialophora psammophila CBS 110553]EXJ69354.1 23S rRNA (-2'-O)-methyltransferase [Cladophialophora psammophila CBS 110553]